MHSFKKNPMATHSQRNPFGDADGPDAPVLVEHSHTHVATIKQLVNDATVSTQVVRWGTLVHTDTATSLEADACA